MNDVCFVSVAFGFEYLKQMDRLRKSILAIYPDANLLFYHDELPPGSKPFLDSLYGFKPHAIQAARDKGYERIIWLDPAMILMDNVSELISLDGVIAVKDDSVLHNVVSDDCYRYFRNPHAWDDIKMFKDFVEYNHWHLVGGSLYYFNFYTPITEKIFNKWLQAEKDGIFGSQWDAASDKLQGHRYDEAVMALCLYTHGITPVAPDYVRYCCTDKPMFIKKHFK